MLRNSGAALARRLSLKFYFFYFVPLKDPQWLFFVEIAVIKRPARSDTFDR